MKGFEKENFLKFFFLFGCYSFRQAGISFSGSKVFFQKSNFSIHGKRCSNYLLGVQIFVTSISQVGDMSSTLTEDCSISRRWLTFPSGRKICSTYLILHISEDRGGGGREFKSKQKDHVLLGHFLHMSEWPM